MNELEDLYKQRKCLYNLIRYAKLYGGRVNVEGTILTLTELKEMLEDVKFNIAAEISTRKLRLIK